MRALEDALAHETKRKADILNQRIALLKRLLTDPESTRLSIRTRLGITEKTLVGIASRAGLQLPSRTDWVSG